MCKPLVIDLYAGLGGWTRGFLAEGYDAVGFDIERHYYGGKAYPAQLVLQDVRTLHGSQFKNAACIVGSSPCQEFSYRAMPWKRAKALPPPYLGIELFEAQFRIQREASEAAGRHIPMVVENVCGAQRWVGRAAWHYGSYYLWGDVPAIMPHTFHRKVPGFNFHAHEKGEKCGSFQSAAVREMEGIKPHGSGAAWFDKALDERRREAGAAVKVSGDWFGPYADMKAAGTISPTRLTGKGTTARKAASAMIAEIPFDLARWIARVYLPKGTPV